MSTCPVCCCECTNNVCAECGFDCSADFEHFPTLQMINVPIQAISALKSDYSAKRSGEYCFCCGTLMAKNAPCLYCGFEPTDTSSPEAISGQAVRHALDVVSNLTSFYIIAYRYVWVAEHSRLEQRATKTVRFGNANDFFNKVYWANDEFAQLCDGEGTELNLQMMYKYKGKRRQVSFAIPTVKCDNFWRIGISLDTSLRLRVSLGSGSRTVTSGAIALDFDLKEV